MRRCGRAHSRSERLLAEALESRAALTAAHAHAHREHLPMDWWALRPPAQPWPGLPNEGATCYLNALLQALFALEEVRSHLFRYAAAHAHDAHADDAHADDAHADDARAAATPPSAPRHRKLVGPSSVRTSPVALMLSSLFARMQQSSLCSVSELVCLALTPSFPDATSQTTHSSHMPHAHVCLLFYASSPFV